MTCGERDDRCEELGIDDPFDALTDIQASAWKQARRADAAEAERNEARRERDALALAAPLGHYWRAQAEKAERERDALALAVLTLTNERDDARASAAT